MFAETVATCMADILLTQNIFSQNIYFQALRPEIKYFITKYSQKCIHILCITDNDLPVLDLQNIRPDSPLHRKQTL